MRLPLFALLLSALSAGAASVTLAWDANPEPEVTGYRLYVGLASRVYTNAVNVGPATTNTVNGLIPGTTYFFAVTAYNASALESEFSDELLYTVPLLLSPPVARFDGPSKTLAWSAVPGATLYRIEHAREDGSFSVLVSTPLLNAALAPIPRGLNRWVVYAVNGQGESLPSNEIREVMPGGPKNPRTVEP